MKDVKVLYINRPGMSVIPILLVSKEACIAG
jgi:hypothetical protein